MINRKRQKYVANDIYDEGSRLKFKTLLKPRTDNQERYIQFLRDTPITIGVGSAGCGKTWVAVRIGLEKLLEGDVDKLIITRPAIEVGDSLGFLPGTLEEKLSPYLIPIVDSLQSHIGVAGANKLIESGKVEIAPLNFMRGRTLTNAFVIFDEAQNSTPQQMLMFLTRFGSNCHYSINGDLHQSDLRGENGLEVAVKVLKNKDKDIKIIEFAQDDIVRSALVGRIVKLFKL